VFTLNLPWQLGADFFLRHLVDGDPASNTLGWRWVCGLHTKGKTYLARVSNITSYTDNRFDPGGQLAVSAPPVQEVVEHPVTPLPAVQVLKPGLRFGLAITEEDCCPETLLADARPQSAIVLPAAAHRSPLPTAQAVREFAIGATLDAASRAQQHFSISVEHASTEEWGESLVSWASSNGLDTIVTAYVPAGPAADQLGIARKALDDRGIRLLQIRRQYDSLCWPHTTRGFFKLKAQIPQLLLRLGIPRQPAGNSREAG
jgi:deoxyribodipyrimidine photo-lyase